MAKATLDQIDGWVTSLTSLIPSGFFEAMAKRESGYSLTESTPESNGTTSIGLWQVNADEASRAGVAVSDLTDGLKNATVIVYLMTQNLYALANKYGFDANSPPSDIWYYLAASHNAGLSRIEGWLDEQGGTIDWNQTKTNHPTFVTIAKGYAQDIGDAAQGGIASTISDIVDDSGGDGGSGILVMLAIGVVAWLAIA